MSAARFVSICGSGSGGVCAVKRGMRLGTRDWGSSSSNTPRLLASSSHASYSSRSIPFPFSFSLLTSSPLSSSSQSSYPSSSSLVSSYSSFLSPTIMSRPPCFTFSRQHFSSATINSQTNITSSTSSISSATSDDYSSDKKPVATIDLNEDLIITKSCANRIKHLQNAAGDHSLGLRISVEGGGCSGFKYVFKMDNLEDNSLAEDDKIFVRNGTKVCVDSTSLDLIKGSTIDYQQEMIRSAFAIVNNPQSESACGCGSSFAVKNFSANPALD